MMCKALIVAAVCLVGAALAQPPPGEHHHHHHVANHTHLLIAIKDEYPRECHFIEIDPQWEALLNDPVKVQQISEEVYHLVHGGNVPETELTPEQLLAKYDDNDSVEECPRHTVKVMSYTPSPSIQG